jgi:type IV pilus assembly protein PilB
MSIARFGELLGRLVPLSNQDVSEILEEQTMSHRRFGQIAMSWGLCQPEHVWEAWCNQLAHCPERVDLRTVGIDTQALTHLSHELAREFGVVPVRSLGERVIVAASEQTLMRAAQDLPRLLGKHVQFVLADAREIEKAISSRYAYGSSSSKN